MEQKGFGGPKETLAAIGLGDFTGLETFQSGYGSMYGVIAKEKGLTLSILPRLDASPFSPFIGVFLRVRAQKAEEWANLADAGVTFGVPELIEKSPEHASVEFYVPVAIQGTVLPHMLGKRVVENKLFAKIADAVADRVEGCEAGGEPRDHRRLHQQQAGGQPAHRGPEGDHRIPGARRRGHSRGADQAGGRVRLHPGSAAGAEGRVRNRCADARGEFPEGYPEG